MDVMKLYYINKCVFLYYINKCVFLLKASHTPMGFKRNIDPLVESPN